MFWQHPIDQALSRLKRSVHASLKVVLWDGREVELGDKPPRVTLRVRNRRTAAALASPSLLTLGQVPNLASNFVLNLLGTNSEYARQHSVDVSAPPSTPTVRAARR